MAAPEWPGIRDAGGGAGTRSRRHGFDDTVIAQSLGAAGIGVAILNGLALHAHRAPGIHATRLPDNARRIYAATYGDPPDPPATTALIELLTSTAGTLRAPRRAEVVSRSRARADGR